MQNKLCRRCNTEKPATHFAKNSRSSDGLQSYCRKCNTVAKSEWIKKNRDKHNASVEKRRQKITEEIYKLKDVPCMDCGIQYPRYVMDFDHREEKDKCFDVSVVVARGGSMKRLMEEVAKCDVVCSNCHRIRTYNRRNGEHL